MLLYCTLRLRFWLIYGMRDVWCVGGLLGLAGLLVVGAYFSNGKASVTHTLTFIVLCVSMVPTYLSTQSRTLKLLLEGS